jgi:preprotein translocase subunit Sec61beta
MAVLTPDNIVLIAMILAVVVIVGICALKH